MMSTTSPAHVTKLLLTGRLQSSGVIMRQTRSGYFSKIIIAGRMFPLTWIDTQKGAVREMLADTHRGHNAALKWHASRRDNFPAVREKLMLEHERSYTKKVGLLRLLREELGVHPHSPGCYELLAYFKIYRATWFVPTCLYDHRCTARDVQGMLDFCPFPAAAP